MRLWQLYNTVELIEMEQRKYGEIETLTKGKSTRETISHGSSNLVNIQYCLHYYLRRWEYRDIREILRRKIHTNHWNFSTKKIPVMIKCNKESHTMSWKHQYNDFVVKEASSTATIARNCAFSCKLTEN